MPKVGAPDCIEIDEAKLPRMTGQPGLISCTVAMPTSASARVTVQVPTAVTGDIAPDRMKGVVRQAWLLRA